MCAPELRWHSVRCVDAARSVSACEFVWCKLSKVLSSKRSAPGGARKGGRSQESVGACILRAGVCEGSFVRRTPPHHAGCAMAYGSPGKGHEHVNMVVGDDPCPTSRASTAFLFQMRQSISKAALEHSPAAGHNL